MKVAGVSRKTKQNRMLSEDHTIRPAGGGV